MTAHWEGGCQCGGVRYTVDPAAVRTLYCCHCRECQRQSGSAFGMSLIVDAKGFRITQGRLKRWVRGTDSGGAACCHFCPDCGCRIYHEYCREDGDGADAVSVKPGTLDDTGVLRPAGHIWTSRAQPWFSFGAHELCAAGEPENEAAFEAAYAARTRHSDP